MPAAHAIEHEINVGSSSSAIREAITTRAGLERWNAARVAGDGSVGSEWVLAYEGGPEFAWRVDRAEASDILWTCTRGPGDAVGTTVEYALAPTGDGRTRLSLRHAGWPHREGNFRKCNTLWGGMLFDLKRTVEGGKSPA